MRESNVVFVGAGAIGLPMVRQLDGRVTAVDPSPTARERTRDAGVEVVSRFTEAPEADLVVVMVATPEQLDALVTEALEGDVAGQRWVIMSTVGPESVREQAARLRSAAATVVDSPVTGGVARARTGALTLFTAGSPDDVAAARPVLERFGAVVEVGDAPGDGQSVKVINQHLCSVHIVAAAEAFALAERLGLEPARALSFLEQGAAGSWMLSDRGPRMVQDGPVEVASSINIFVKDSGLVAAAARSVDAETPLLDIARDRYLRAADAGLSTSDDSRVVETYQRGRESEHDRDQ